MKSHSVFGSSTMRRSVIVSLLTCAGLALAGANARAANQNWDGGSVADGNWGTVDNWNGAIPGATNSTVNPDTATFNAAIANTWGDAAGNPIAVDPNRNIRTIIFDASVATLGNYFVGSTGGNALLLSSGGNIQISSGTAVNPVETISAPLAIQGTNGTYTFQNSRNNAAASLVLGGAISGAFAGNTVISFAGSGTPTNNLVNGVISDGSATSLGVSQTAAIWLFTAANTMSGPLTVSGGTMSLGTPTVSGGSMQNVSSIALSGASTLKLDNTAGTVDRILDNRGVTLTGTATLNLVGNGSASSSTETIGTVAIGAGHTAVAVSGTGAGQVQTLASGGFSRADRGTAVVRGSSMQILASNSTRFTADGTNGTGFVFVGAETSALGTATTGTVKKLRIVPYLIGDSSATGSGNNFLTYDVATNGGMRPLASGEYLTLTAAHAVTNPADAENVKSFNGTLLNNTIVNSLFMFNHLLDGNNSTLTINSGAIFNNQTAGAIVGAGFSKVVLGNGSWNEGILMSVNGTLTNRSPLDVTGGGGVTKAGTGVVSLEATNLYTGTTLVNAGRVNLANNLAIQDSPLDTSGGGTVSLGGTNGQTTVTTPTLGGLVGTKNLTASMTVGYTGVVTSLTLNPGTNAVCTYPAVIANGAAGMALTKSGTGTQILSGTNTFSGATTVGAGTLLVNGSLQSTVTVSSAATFGGMGTVPEATFNTGAGAKFFKTTAASDTPLNVTGALTLNSTTVTVEIAGAPLGVSTSIVCAAGSISGTPFVTPVITGLGLDAGVAATVAVNGNNLELRVAPSGGGSPVLGVSPTSYDFGGVQVGSVSSVTFAVTNSGNAQLTGNASVSLSQFALVASTNFSIAAGGSSNVTISFTPTLADSYADNVVFLSDGGGATNGLAGYGFIIAGSTNASISRSAGQVAFSFNIASGALYRVEATTNLLNGAGWTNITDQFTNRFIGVPNYIDTNSAAPMRAYRVSSP